jgi:hypothetical protein
MTDWSVTWDESYPAGTDAASGIATYIEQDKIAVRERLNSLLGITTWGTSTGPPMKGYQLNLTGGANANIQIGTTDFSFYDSTNSIQLFKITSAGSATFFYDLTIANGVTVTAGGLTITAGGITISAGGLAVSGNTTLNKTTVSSGQGVISRYNAGNSSTALTLDFNNGNNQLITLTGNCTFTFSNPVSGAWYSLELLQDATGSRTVTWPASVKWSGGTAPTLTTTASKTDVMTFYYNGTYYFGFQAGFNY